MGLTQTKLHFKILREKWPGVAERVSKPMGLAEARTTNPLGDLPLHYAAYSGRAPPFAIRALMLAYPDGAAVRNKAGFRPLELAEVNYRRESPYREEVLAVLRGATDVAEARNRARAEGALADADADAVEGGVPREVYRTSADCVVCLDAPATEVVSPCGHLCLCTGCAPQVRKKRICPVGRCYVASIVSMSECTAATTAAPFDRASGGEDSPFEDEVGVALATPPAPAAVPAC